MIERAIDKLARRHGAHINEYDANNGADNARRLTGKNGMPHIKDFTAGNQFNYKQFEQGYKRVFSVFVPKKYAINYQDYNIKIILCNLHIYVDIFRFM